MENALILLAAFAAATVGSAQKIMTKGSVTLGPKLVPTLAEDYMTKHSDVSFEIAAEGSTKGITAAIDAAAEIGMSSRRAMPTEVSPAQAKGVTLKPTIACFDPMAVNVNSKGPILGFTPQQVEQIFTGDITNWSAAGGPTGAISVYNRNTASGTCSDWRDLAMERRDYARFSQKLVDNDQIAAAVSKNANDIGSIGLAYIHAKGTRIVAIGGVLPTKETDLSRRYPYARPTFYDANGEPHGEAAKFVEFALSTEGQKIGVHVGFTAAK